MMQPDETSAVDTTETTIVRGPRDDLGWANLEQGAGEAYCEPVPQGEVIGCLWHLSDLHVCDSESPARLEYLDRFSDPDSAHRDQLGDIGTYRPQEILTVQVATTMVRTVNRRTTGPTTGAPIDAVLITGDVTDNAQSNELDWFSTVVGGGIIAARSGDPAASSWVGSSSDPHWDERYWHPDPPPDGFASDRPTRLYGYPSIPGLVEAARADVHSPGLALPCLTVHGNHDALLQGTVAADAELMALAVGGERITGLPMGHTPEEVVGLVADTIAAVGPARYLLDPRSPRQALAADPSRRIVAPGEFAQQTCPAGATAGPGNTWTADVGRLRVIAIDTVNPHGGWQGSLDRQQCDWMIGQIRDATGRYVVITSHHPSPTLVNSFDPTGANGRVLGPEVVSILLAHPNVIAWIAGHVHCHAALRHGDDSGGFWEVTTSSLIDWPQQGRIIEFVRDGDGIALISTIVDHEAPARWDAGQLADPAHLASISRALAANDYRLRESSLRGLMLDSAPEVRNTVWRLPDPFAG